ncbi:MAG TPA: hypothetical protein VGB75_10865 [Jatrophihabitans sp.]|jgi:hypothetical protein|uniref:hypothetical protein n=1 Tax=Jatrophihabitans sp. TaxID=1932789 RepID=UPI002EFCBEF3
MSALTLGFEGFVQVRLATDPDPSDEPRGVSGWTHAVAGEPDLDRVLVLQDDDPRRVRRSRGPRVGVTVRSVEIDGVASSGHPLLGARVELLDAPKFEGRNWVIASDGAEPIYPLHLRISAPGLVLDKRDALTDSAGASIPFYLIGPQDLERRTPTMEGDPGAQAEVMAALGVPDNDPVAWRQARKNVLREDLDALDAADEVTATALRVRIADIEAGGIAEALVGIRMRYRLLVHGPGSSSVPAGALPGKVGDDADWKLDFWVGGWDADALCMYLRGAAEIPLA